MGRIALVTGGTRGIGAAISRDLAEAGYSVAASYVGNDDVAAALARETGIRVFRWNVADYDACQDGTLKVVKELGGPVEVLVNNAGITQDAMRDRAFGRIVNVSSINGQKGQLGQANYAAAKAGVLGFTKALALEGAPKGITVNAIAPGYIETDMVAAVPPEALAKIQAAIPVGRLGQTAEIARIVRFLASDEAAFITGATVTANGGQYMT